MAGLVLQRQSLDVLRSHLVPLLVQHLHGNGVVLHCADKLNKDKRKTVIQSAFILGTILMNPWWPACVVGLGSVFNISSKKICVVGFVHLLVVTGAGGGLGEAAAGDAAAGLRRRFTGGSPSPGRSLLGGGRTSRLGRS